MLLAVASAPAQANMGVPMLAVVWPVAWLLLLAIIPLEAMVAVRTLRLPLLKALILSALANLFSTMLGIPAAWLTMLGIQFAASLVLLVVYGIGIRIPENIVTMAFGTIIMSAWLAPFEHAYHWTIPLAAAVLCVPFYLMSVRFDFSSAKGSFEEERWPSVLRWSKLANGISYGLIVAGLLILLAWNTLVLIP